MSSKRSADRQISKDGDNGDDSEQEVTYGITRASAEEIKSRRILHVKRPSNSISSHIDASKKAGEEKKDGEANQDEQDQETTSNPFASIQLTSSGGTTSTSVFGASTGFSGFYSSTANTETKESGPSIFGASSGFQGFGSVASSSSSGFGTDTPQESAPAVPSAFGGFASLSSASPSNSFSFGNNKTDETKEKTEQEEVKDDDAGGNDIASSSSNNNAKSNALPNLPEDYKLQSGEEGHELQLELRCKSYRWMKKVHVAETKQEKSAPSVPSTELFTKSEEDKIDGKTDSSSDGNSNEMALNKEQQMWIEQGVGAARILQIPNSNDQFARLTQRRQVAEGGKQTKVITNILIGRESTADPHADKVVRVSSVEFTDEGNKPVLYLFRFKDADMATKFLDCLKKVILQAKSFQKAKIEGDKITETPNEEE